MAGPVCPSTTVVFPLGVAASAVKFGSFGAAEDPPPPPLFEAGGLGSRPALPLSYSPLRVAGGSPPLGCF